VTAVLTSRIQKTPGVCGGWACIRSTRITVSGLVTSRKLGTSEERLLEAYPSLTADDLAAAWAYYGQHPLEIEQEMWFNDTAANVAIGEPAPNWVLVAGKLLGISDAEICESFEPPVKPADIAAAWDAYRADPVRMDAEIAELRFR
jgi:uncharacterized protein (DUF433 family)